MYLKVAEWINWETPKLAEIGRQCKTNPTLGNSGGDKT